MTIGERIHYRRKEIGMSVDELADKLGKNRATIYRYESNDIEKLPVNVLEPLAIALNVTPAYLMGWEEVVEKATEPVNPVWDELRNELMQLDIEELRELRNYIRYLISKRKEQD